jgi:hypothetical protein
LADGSTFFDGLSVENANGIVDQPRLPRFKAYTNYDNHVGIGTWTKIGLNNTDYNDQGAFDAANNRFVAPVDGTYLFGATLLYKINASTSARMSGRLVLNGTTEIRGSFGEISGAHVSEATALWLQTIPMKTKISMLAIDLAKGSFQVCAVGQDGAVLSNRAMSRTRLAALLAEQPTCVAAMEACATSHHWGRLAQAHGHEVRLVPAAYVKPFVKRQKNDRADAEAIAEAALRPTMRFVAVKGADTQARAVAFRTHQCLVRQRTQLINALRGHLAEFGLVAPQGPASLKVLENAMEAEATDLPDPVREMGAVYLEQIGKGCSAVISARSLASRRRLRSSREPPQG